MEYFLDSNAVLWLVVTRVFTKNKNVLKLSHKLVHTDILRQPYYVVIIVT